MDGLEVGPARFFHSCQPVGIDAFKVVRFSFPVISEFLTPFTTIVPDVSKRYHIGVENLFASMKKNEFAVIINNEGVVSVSRVTPRLPEVKLMTLIFR